MVKTPVVLLPGLLCDSRLWERQIEYLGDQYDIQVPDLTEHRSISAMGRTVLKAAPERFALAGLSMGGYVALEIMRLAPERVTRLALLDTSARADTPEQTEERRELIRLARTGSFDQVLERLLPRLIHPRRLSDGTLTSLIVRMAKAVGIEAFMKQEHAIIERTDSRKKLGAITCPTLVLCGRDDIMTPPPLHEELAIMIPAAQLRVIEGCGHLSTLEHPRTTTEALYKWLTASGR